MHVVEDSEPEVPGADELAADDPDADDPDAGDPDDPDTDDAELDDAELDDAEPIATTDGRIPGHRGRATRQRLLECTAELLVATPWRSIKVIDIARQAGTSPATFYQYFENVESAITVLAEELVEGVGILTGLVEGDWSEE